MGRSDNENFLEHFRYIIIGSQLLNDHSSSSSFYLPNAVQASQDATYAQNAITITGALSSALLAFSFSWILSWATDTTSGVRPGRLTLLFVLTTLLAAFLVAYARRQWLQYLRRQAIEVAIPPALRCAPVLTVPTTATHRASLITDTHRSAMTVTSAKPLKAWLPCGSPPILQRPIQLKWR